MTDPITLLVADDHPLFRRGLVDVLQGDPAIRVVGEAGDGELALELIRQLRPRIALLDVEMPRASGIAVAEAVRREGLGTALVILTAYTDAGMFRRALDLGAKGYVLKDAAVSEIGACVHLVAAGRPYISPALSGHLLARQGSEPGVPLAGLESLSPAERRVVRLVARGLTSAGIAEALGNSPKTVENIRGNACRKLGLTGPQALLRFALEHKALLE